MGNESKPSVPPRNLMSDVQAALAKTKDKQEHIYALVKNGEVVNTIVCECPNFITKLKQSHDEVLRVDGAGDFRPSIGVKFNTARQSFVDESNEREVKVNDNNELLEVRSVRTGKKINVETMEETNDIDETAILEKFQESGKGKE